MKRASPRRVAIWRIALSASSRTRIDSSDNWYVSGAIVTGPAFGRTAFPFGGGDWNTPSCVSSTCASSSMWSFQFDTARFFWIPHHEPSFEGSRPSSYRKLVRLERKISWSVKRLPSWRGGGGPAPEEGGNGGVGRAL